MTNKSILALVASRSDSLQNGLLALTTTIPAIGAVLVAEDTDATLRMIENHGPALVILDLSFRQAQDLIREIKARWPQIQMIVIVENTAEQKEVEDLDADCVLLQGFTAHKFVAFIDATISDLDDAPLAQANTESGSDND